MANLYEKIEWTAGIRQLETTDAVMGGPDGIDNIQAKQLANRTQYLKYQIEINASTETAGRVKLNSAIDSESETEAATPLAVKIVYDLASSAQNNAAHAQRTADSVYSIANTAKSIAETNASTETAGRVKLNSAIDSESETEAATPWAVKTVNDKINNFNDKFTWSDQYQHSVVMSPNKKYHFIVRNDGVVGVYSSDVKNIVWSFSNENFNNGVISANKINDLDQFVRDRTTPVGVPLPWPQSYPPAGYFECNGSTFNKNQCPKLAVAYPHGFLPDLRGEFIRGWDNGKGSDPSRGILSWQNDAIRNIWGELESFVTGATNNSIYAGAFSTSVNSRPAYQPAATGGGSHQKLTLNAATQVPTAHENRPRNVAFMYIVKAE